MLDVSSVPNLSRSVLLCIEHFDLIGPYNSANLATLSLVRIKLSPISAA